MAANETMELSKLAKLLEAARIEKREISQITQQKSDLTLADAYKIQAAGIRLRATKGERVVGYKMGLTSKAKMQQVGVHQPIYGVLTDTMLFSEQVALSHFIHPRVEPEIAFILGHDIETVLTPAQAIQACSGVCVALEVIDSRYKDFSFTLPDVVADNCSAAGFILSSNIRRLDRQDIGNLGIVLELNGIPCEFASSAAILGHPARSLAELTKLLIPQGEILRAGSVVLAGGATAAVSVKAGDYVRAQAQGLGSVSVSLY